MAVPDQHDLALAKEDALLQLRIGRTAHIYTLILFAALLADGFLLLLLDPYVAGGSLLQSLFYLIFPLGGAIMLSGFGVWVKWDAYQIWPWESHFWITVLSVPAAAGLTYLLAARFLDYGPTAGWNLVPGYLPLVFLGVTLPIVGLAHTWPGWSRRKAGAVIAAVMPVPIALTLFLPSSAGSLSALTLALIASGGLYLAAGSLLHLTSSGTDAHEREMIVSGQSRLFQFSDELMQREDALRAREASLIRREADVEVGESGLARKTLSLEDLQKQLEQVERDLETRANRVHADFQEAALKIAEASQLQRELGDREAQLKIQEDATTRWESRRNEREAALSQAEGELVRRQLEVANQEKDAGLRSPPATEAESALDARKAELDRRSEELLQREAAFSAQSLAVGVPSTDAREQEIARREATVAQIQQTISEQSGVLGRRAKELDARRDELRAALEAQTRKEADLASRERLLVQHESDSKLAAEAAGERQRQYTEAIQRVEERARNLERQQAELAGRLDDVGRHSLTVHNREGALRSQQEELQRARADLESAQKNLVARQKELDSRATPATIPVKPGGLSNATVAPTTGSLPVPAPAVVRATTRVAGHDAPTGIPRLDELLLGGLTDHAQIMLIGPPFVGRELVLYSFLMAGLKRGESAVVVTTNRSASEVAQEMMASSPEFKQYEGVGKIHWIDASNPSAVPTLDESKGSVRAVVKGPGDFAGILTALAAAMRPPSQGGSDRAARIGVMNLSACLAQGDAKATFGFVHNFVSILKLRSALGLYAVDPGILSDAQLESTLARMDGAIRFREDRGKTQLSVQGMGEVATRDWVEYRASNRALVVGSFALERIR
ncbi:MAG TPA: ATPase domain-containing protein [Thermoplasmata archaeon]|nr:ATPase domain-containing protein [Thermoplasmata archaeon]